MKSGAHAYRVSASVTESSQPLWSLFLLLNNLSSNINIVFNKIVFSSTVTIIFSCSVSIFFARNHTALCGFCSKYGEWDGRVETGKARRVLEEVNMDSISSVMFHD